MEDTRRGEIKIPGEAQMLQRRSRSVASLLRPTPTQRPETRDNAPSPRLSASSSSERLCRRVGGSAPASLRNSTFLHCGKRYRIATWAAAGLKPARRHRHRCVRTAAPRIGRHLLVFHQAFGRRWLAENSNPGAWYRAPAGTAHHVHQLWQLWWTQPRCHPPLLSRSYDAC